MTGLLNTGMPNPVPERLLLTWSPLIVLVDMDGVVCDWFGQAMSELQVIAQETLGKDLDLSLFQDWKIEETLSRYFPSLVEPFVALTRAPGFYANLKPIEGAISGVLELSNMGHQIFFCSSPENEAQGHCCHTEKAAWIHRHFAQVLGINWVDRLILTKDKTLVYGDVLIDDKENVLGVIEPAWEHIVFESQVNHLVEHRYNWDSVPARINQISYAKFGGSFDD